MSFEAIILLEDSYFGNALATVKQFYAQNGLRIVQPDTVIKELQLL